VAQDQHSGSRAAKWGRETARRIAEVIGASSPAGASNACTLNGKRVVIKCARARTRSVGVTYLMLDELDAVIGAFELDDESFELWELTPQLYTRISDLVVVLSSAEQASRLDFPGSDARNPARTGDTLWVRRNPSPFSSPSTGF
jgi:hypothetical protein